MAGPRLAWPRRLAGTGRRVTLSRSRLEDVLDNRLQIAGLSGYVREYRFAPPRKFRADFAYVEARLLLEVEGGIYSNGRHTRGSGFAADCEKYNLATLLGFKVLRFTAEMIQSGGAVEAITRALNDPLVPERQG